MIRVIIGSVAGAVAMFVIGFVFFATPLGNIAVKSLGDSEAASIQAVLAETMGEQGDKTVLVPYPEGEAQQRMYIDGPIAMVHYSPDGFAVGGADVMLGGFIHMLVSALILGGALYYLAGHAREFGERMKIVILFSLAASCFMHLGMPIWWHQDWTYHSYLFVADFVSLVVAGGIIARWFLPRDIASDDRFGAETH